LKHNYVFSNRDGFVVNTDIFHNPEFYAMAKIKGEQIQAFIEVDKDDNVKVFAGSLSYLRQIKNHFCIETNKF
jgi:hypothetical protein